jgi:hypothetical protein
MDLARRGQTLESPVDSLRDPYVLDFLNLPDSRLLHEGDLVSTLAIFRIERSSNNLC